MKGLNFYIEFVLFTKSRAQHLEIQTKAFWCIMPDYQIVT